MQTKHKEMNKMMIRITITQCRSTNFLGSKGLFCASWVSKDIAKEKLGLTEATPNAGYPGILRK